MALAYHTELYLFVFLPLVVLVYHFSSQKMRRAVLILAGYIFFWSFSQWLVGYLIAVSGLVYGAGRWMEHCSLWGVVSFSICGATYPLFSMDSPIQSIGQLFPMRHYYMIYQMNIFNGFPMSDAVLHWGAMVLFCALPMSPNEASVNLRW